MSFKSRVTLGMQRFLYFAVTSIKLGLCRQINKHDIELHETAS